jgi:serine/threonine protein kinase
MAGLSLNNITFVHSTLARPFAGQSACLFACLPGCSALQPPATTSVSALQELQILESLPFDKHVVEFHGSYTQDDNIYMVLEFMQVTNC